ncbi:MAG: penicillin-binding protein 2 [Chlamydiia bacterium]|nr:penicillin-binding protein 2 [Chlamydiia bacterium]
MRQSAFSPPGSPDRRRLAGLALVLFLLFATLIVRFYKIQIIEHEKWTQQALAQHEHAVTIPFMRGSFYSNTSIKKGHPEEDFPFVVDVPKFHLFIDPDSIPAELKGKMAAELVALLPLSSQKKSKAYAEFERKSRSRKIATWLDRKERLEIEKWWGPFSKREKIPRNALFFTSEFKRSYPFGSLLGAVLHTVQDARDPKDQQNLPTGGLEMLFHPYLKGSFGKKIVRHSPRNPLDTGKIVIEPENGADIYLTVNHYLQAMAEAELQKGVEAARAKGGWAVMMDPYTGEILAIAQTPPFDLTRYADYFNDPQLQERTRVKAVSDCYEPGSIFKPITIAVCMKANEELVKHGKKPIFAPEEKVPCANGWFPGRSTPLKDARVHSFLNLELALQKSSNVYMARLIHRLIESMGDEWYRRTLSEVFGFGKKTGIELPAEQAGLLPTPGKLHPNGKLEWSLPTPYSLAIGHNILINAMQIVRAYAIFANGGKAVQPHLVRKIVKTMPDGTKKILLDLTGYRASEQVLNPTVCKTIVRGMKFATKEGGTSKRADIPGYTEAGKSGTAEKIIEGVYSKDHHIASFLGFAPADNPRFVLLVSLDDPEKRTIPGIGKMQMGGVSAAPVFREIAGKALQYLGVTPDDPYGWSLGDPRRDPKKAHWAREVEALKELYHKWNGGT